MNVISHAKELFLAARAPIIKAALPHRLRTLYPVREAPFDQTYRTLDGDTDWREEQMNVLRHDDKGVEEETAFSPVMLEHLDEQISRRNTLEKTTPIKSRGRNKKGARMDGSQRLRHPGESNPPHPGAEAPLSLQKETGPANAGP